MNACSMEVIPVLFEDEEGNIWLADEIDELSAWEIAEKRLHVYEAE